MLNKIKKIEQGIYRHVGRERYCGIMALNDAFED